MSTPNVVAPSQFMCLSCGHELPTRLDVHQIDVTTSDGRQINGHGPFCFSCADAAKGISFAQWLDEQGQRQN
jgi:hypothetical protein